MPLKRKAHVDLRLNSSPPASAYPSVKITGMSPTFNFLSFKGKVCVTLNFCSCLHLHGARFTGICNHVQFVEFWDQTQGFVQGTVLSKLSPQCAIIIAVCRAEVCFHVCPCFLRSSSRPVILVC